jgi:hypothetical protein
MFMAAQGLRDMGDGPEKVADAQAASALRSRGRQVFLVSAATALAATLVAILAETV